jgi:hypothetical protein
MDVQNSACIAFFIPDGTRAMRNYQISPFQNMKAAEIHSELALCFGDDAYTLASVHHWVHEFKIGRVSINDDPRPGRPPLDDVDAAVLKRLREAPFSSLRTLSEDLHIPRVVMWDHMTKPLGL